MTLESISIPRKRAYPPRVSAFTKPFWEGLAQGRWQTTCCTACDTFTFPPKPICPHCWADKMVWKNLATRGTLYSWTVEAPYSVCVVDLDIGLRIATRLIDREGIEFKPGILIDIVVLQFEDGPLFASRPV
jgi:uncharacterized OB-fold protein